MVCPGVLFLLLSLLSGTTGVGVDQNALRKIIQHIENTYNPTQGSVGAGTSSDAGASASASASASAGEELQYAVAIRIPRTLCEHNSQESITGLPASADVIAAINSKEREATPLYISQTLVAARPQGTGNNAVHSERLLLNVIKEDIGMTPMKHLIREHKDNCVVFYTYNSPCIEHCLNQKKDDEERSRIDQQTKASAALVAKGKKAKNISPPVYKCIIEPIREIVGENSGPVAFVFNKIYEDMTKYKDHLDALLPLAKVVPLYRCTEGACARCGDTEDSLKNNNC